METLSPWSHFDPAFMVFCEHSLNTWIRQPANALSSLSYILVGIFVLLQKRQNPVLKVFGWMGMLVGLASAIYHCSMIFWTEVFDFGSMFLFATALVMLNWQRMKPMPIKKWTYLYIGLNILSLALLIYFKKIGVLVFSAQVVLGIIMEYRLKTTQHLKKSIYRYYFLALGAFELSFVIWLLDYFKIVCDPNNHWLQGHAFWHLINSTVFFFMYKFYLQFFPKDIQHVVDVNQL